MQPQPVSPGVCPNCGHELLGKFCYSCGQKKVDDKERTLKHFFTEFLHASFHIEHNILGSFWKLLSRPGFIVREYIDGRRKRYMSPFAVFAVVNILYFLFSPLTDLSLKLHDQPRQFYGPVAQSMIDNRRAEREVTFETYAAAYDAKSNSLSKLMVIINVPFFALFIALMYIKNKKVFFADHLIFALNFFGFFLLYSLVMVVIFNVGARLHVPFTSNVFQFTFLGGSLIYLLFAVRKVYQESWGLTLIKSAFLIFGFLITHIIYRFILFMTTFLAT